LKDPKIRSAEGLALIPNTFNHIR